MDQYRCGPEFCTLNEELDLKLAAQSTIAALYDVVCQDIAHEFVALDAREAM